MYYMCVVSERGGEGGVWNWDWNCGRFNVRWSFDGAYGSRWD